MKIRKLLVVLILSCTFCFGVAFDEKDELSTPTFEDKLNIQETGNSGKSAGSNYGAYTINSTIREKNVFANLDLVIDDFELKIDKIFADIDKKNAPGLSVAVSIDGKILFNKSYGYANLEYGIPFKTDTPTPVASVSKQFTAFAIVSLAQQGKLNLDDDIRKYIPEMSDLGAKVSIRHILHHLSGIRDHVGLFILMGLDACDVITQKQLLKLAYRQKELNSTPGEIFAYTNTGYALLAEVVARITGESFQEWTKKNIFVPAGMKNSKFNLGHEHLVQNRAYSYDFDRESGKYRKAILSNGIIGSTGLYSTAKDLVIWADNYDKKTVGGASVINQMLTKGLTNDGNEVDYGCGLFMSKWRGIECIGHPGSDAGFSSNMRYFPEYKLAIAIVSNCRALGVGERLNRVAEIFLGDKMKSEETSDDIDLLEGIDRTPVKVDRKVLEKYIGQYLFFDERAVLKVYLEDNRLNLSWFTLHYVRDVDYKEAVLTPISSTRFINDQNPEVIEFIPDENNEFNVAQLTQSNREVKGKRVNPFEPTRNELAEYVGDYYCPELMSVYSLILTDGSLVMTHIRHIDIKLEPFTRDTFKGHKSRVNPLKFLRDNDGKIAGFTISGDWIFDLKFKKVQLD